MHAPFFRQKLARQQDSILIYPFSFHVIFYGLRSFLFSSTARSYNIPGSGLWISCQPFSQSHTKNSFPMCSSWHSLYTILWCILLYIEITHFLVCFYQQTARSLRTNTVSCFLLYPPCLTQLLINDLFRKCKKKPKKVHGI